MYRNVPLRFSLAAAVTLFAVGAQAGDGLDYRFAPQDKLHIRVYDWQQAEGTLREWPAFNGEFAVGGGGKVDLPLIGAVDAGSRIAPEVAADIAARLQAQVGLIEKPSVIVDVAEYRPYYVSGDVEHAGEFAFRPGLTVLKVYSISGGLRQVQGPSTWQPTRDLLSSAGEARTLAQQIAQFKVKRARLEAELADQASISFPPELGAAAKPLVDSEQKIFDARRSALRQGLDSLASQKALNEQEVAALEGRIKVTADALQKTSAELDRNKGLLENGLITATRIMALEQSQSDLQSQELDINGRIFIVREQIAKIEKDMLDLQSQRHQDLLADMQATETGLREADDRMKTLNGIVEQAQAAVGSGTMVSPMPLANLIRFSIRRGDQVLSVGDGQDLEVEPGDIITIERADGQTVGGLTPGQTAQTSVAQAAGTSPQDVQ